MAGTLHPWLAREFKSDRNAFGDTLSSENHTTGKRLQMINAEGVAQNDSGEELVWVTMGDGELFIHCCVPIPVVEQYNSTVAESFTSSSNGKDLFKLSSWRFILGRPVSHVKGNRRTLPERLCLRIDGFERYGNGGDVVVGGNLPEFSRGDEIREWGKNIVDRVHRDRVQDKGKGKEVEQVEYADDLPNFAPKEPQSLAPQLEPSTSTISQAFSRSNAHASTTASTSAATTSARDPAPFAWSTHWPPRNLSWTDPCRPLDELEDLWHANEVKRIERAEKARVKVDPDVLARIREQKEKAEERARARRKRREEAKGKVEAAGGASSTRQVTKARPETIKEDPTPAPDRESSAPSKPLLPPRGESKPLGASAAATFIKASELLADWKRERPANIRQPEQRLPRSPGAGVPEGVGANSVGADAGSVAGLTETRSQPPEAPHDPVVAGMAARPGPRSPRPSSPSASSRHQTPVTTPRQASSVVEPDVEASARLADVSLPFDDSANRSFASTLCPLFASQPRIVASFPTSSMYQEVVCGDLAMGNATIESLGGEESLEALEVGWPVGGQGGIAKEAESEKEEEEEEDKVRREEEREADARREREVEAEREEQARRQAEAREKRDKEEKARQRREFRERERQAQLEREEAKRREQAIVAEQLKRADEVKTREEAAKKQEEEERDRLLALAIEKAFEEAKLKEREEQDAQEERERREEGARRNATTRERLEVARRGATKENPDGRPARPKNQVRAGTNRALQQTQPETPRARPTGDEAPPSSSNHPKKRPLPVDASPTLGPGPEPQPKKVRVGPPSPVSLPVPSLTNRSVESTEAPGVVAEPVDDVSHAASEDTTQSAMRPVVPNLITSYAMMFGKGRLKFEEGMDKDAMNAQLKARLKRLKAAKAA
ncbi:hypothetical protein JCM10212_003504 [Sporobolomyces blumeae]